MRCEPARCDELVEVGCDLLAVHLGADQPRAERLDLDDDDVLAASGAVAGASGTLPEPAYPCSASMRAWTEAGDLKFTALLVAGTATAVGVVPAECRAADKCGVTVLGALGTAMELLVSGGVNSPYATRPPAREPASALSAVTSHGHAVDDDHAPHERDAERDERLASRTPSSPTGEWRDEDEHAREHIDVGEEPQV